VLHDGAGDTDHIGLLEGIIADLVLGHLAGNHHQRNRIHISGGNAGNGIGSAGTGRHQHRTDFTGDAGIGIRSMDCRLLMAHQNMIDFVLPENGIVDVQCGTTRVAPEMLDACIVQGTDQDIAAR